MLGLAPNVEGVNLHVHKDGDDLHVHKDGDDPLQWARYVVESQLNSEARLVNLESEIRKATRDRKENDAKEKVKLAKSKKSVKSIFDLFFSVRSQEARASCRVAGDVTELVISRDSQGHPSQKKGLFNNQVSRFRSGNAGTFGAQGLP